jgi:general secretion pathway protein N
VSAVAPAGSFWVALWGGAAAALALVIGVEYHLGAGSAAESPRAPAKVADAKMIPPFTLAAAEQVAPETAARPLFSPMRRPAPPVATFQPTMRKGQFVLSGVTASKETSFAFLREVATGKTRSIKQGEEVNGLKVDTVEPRRVVLRQGEETEELTLSIQVPPKMAAPAPPPQGQPVPGAAAAPPPGQPLGPGTPGSPGVAAPVNPAATPTPGGDNANAGRRRPWMKP